jgi:O-antigen biosynthesis protein
LIGVPILLYHSVSTQAAPRYRRYTVAPQVFASHMAYLAERSYTPVTVKQFANAMSNSGVELPDRAVVLTFDDGLADFYTGALPVLAQQGFAATLFVVSGFVGDTSHWLQPEGEGHRPMLTWAQLAEIADRRVEIGAHSHSHPPLDVLPRAAAYDEVIRSKIELEQRLGRPVTSFAYPHGYYNGAVQGMLEAVGYSAGCAVKHALSSLGDDRFAMSRIVVPSDATVEDLHALITGRALPRAPRRERLRTSAWRYVRKVRRRFRRNPVSRTS